MTQQDEIPFKLAEWNNGNICYCISESEAQEFMRLRNEIEIQNQENDRLSYLVSLGAKSAEDNSRLRKQNEIMREALIKITDYQIIADYGEALEIAEAALEEVCK